MLPGPVFYRWIESIGLSPAKSRSIGPLAVPDQYFADFARGFGGDGSIVVYMDRYHCGKDPRYVYKRLSTVCRLVQRHVVPTHRNPRFDLGESVRCGAALLGAALRPARIPRLLPWLYYAPSVPCLARKRVRSEPFLRLAGAR